MRTRVLYFAAARERAGVPEETLELPLHADGSNPKLGEVLAALEARHPALAALRPHLRFALNQEFTDVGAEVPDGAELALIPPVAGGSGGGVATGSRIDDGDRAQLQPFCVLPIPLELSNVVEHVRSTEAGGVVTFTGNVRSQTAGKRVVRLEYEAYQPMAEACFARIGHEVSERWPGTRLSIHHRVGVLTPGETAVVLAAAAAHRKEAFLACEHALERLKAEAPIWKREVFEDGAVWVGLGP